ncbi:hypothetical protein JAB2_37890 [Janthinobacterium sp. HH100]|nr:hypothetical protein JAB2_37890 [Janthinobacterium sp. HH100]
MCIRDLDEEQQDADGLDEEVVHECGDAQKQHQPVEPYDPGEQDQAGAPARRKRFRRRLVQREQAFAQVPAGQRECAAVQVGQAQVIGQQEVAVKAHEGTGIDGHGGDPGGGRKQEGDLLGAAIGQPGPGQRGPGGDHQFRHDAGARHGQALLTARQLPHFVGVRVRHGPHHQEGQAHGRHAAAVALGRQRVAHLMADFGEGDGGAVQQGTMPAQRVEQGGGKAFPVAVGAGHSQQAGGQRQPAEGGRKQPPEARREPVQPAVRAHQRDAEKQVVMQQPLLPAAALALARGRHRRRGALARLQQLLLAQEVEQALDGTAVELQGGALVDVVDEGLGVVVLPAAQHLEAGPVELEEQVAHGVVQGPAGLAVGQAWAGMDGQLLAQQG